MNLPNVFSFNSEQNEVLGWDNFCATGISGSLHNTPNIEGLVAQERQLGYDGGHTALKHANGSAAPLVGH
jgi:hypothetical protein